MKQCYSTILVFIFIINPIIRLQAQQAFTIQLQSEQFTPTPNLDHFFSQPNDFQAAYQDGFYHVLMQFETLPNKNTLQQIKANNIILANYIPNKAYFARLPISTSKSFLKSIKVRSLQVIQPLWKKSNQLNNIPTHAIKEAGKADLNIQYFKGIELHEVATALQNVNAEILFIGDAFQTFTIRIPIENIAQLAQQPIFTWIEPIDPLTEINNKRSKANHRSNTLSANYSGGRNLNGNGVVIGVWDTNLVPHIDFESRVTAHESLYAGTSGDHANHVTGTITGAGLLNPNALGMAPKATVHNWNCCTQTPQPIYQTMRDAVSNQDIVITSNSYGFPRAYFCGDDFGYSNNNRNLDQVAFDIPWLSHVFSAGNSQGDCPDPFGTITYSHKNSFLVAATNTSSSITNFSSFGPLYDGRLAPTISGVGQNVFSTELDNDYGSKNGTSMSCPGVSGTLAQLYERYRQLHNNNPDAALIKALVCNTATDQGNKGPDYKYGFGQIDALRAVKAMESGHWLIDSVQQNTTNNLNIVVPAGNAEVRIMLAWTDLPASSNAAFALVNDLDIILTNGTDTIYPWILDPAQPNLPATKGADHINNIVQIIADTLPAGSYQVIVKGETIVNGSQTYALVYETYMPEITVTYPFGGEKFTAGTVENIQWTALGISNSFTVEYSVNNGSSWQTLGSFNSGARRAGWSVPNNFTNNALVRISSGGISSQSDTTFTIASIPNFSLGVNPLSPLCGEQAVLEWDFISGANAYEVLQVDSLGLHFLGVTVDSFFNVNNLSVGKEYWFTVRALNTLDDIVGERAIAKSIILKQGVDLAITEIVSPSSSCSLGQESVTIEIENKGCRTYLTGEQIPLSISINGGATIFDTLTLSSPLISNGNTAFTYTNLVDLSQSTMSYDITTGILLSSDTLNSNDYITKEVNHQPTFSNFPYVESFEANNGYWSTDYLNFSSWEWGNPNNSPIFSASNGSKVWMTNLNSDYQYLEISNIYSPCFDFTALTTDPYVIFDINYDLGSHIDRGRIQYSLNNGQTWSNLSTYFLGNSNGWQTRQYRINNAAGATDVKFRLELYSDNNENVGSGLAIDHFRISANPLTSTNVLELDAEMSIYPNPNQGLFNVTFQNLNGQTGTLNVIDMFGKIITTQSVTINNNEETVKVNLETLANGIYLIQMQTNEGQLTKRVIINK